MKMHGVPLLIKNNPEFEKAYLEYYNTPEPENLPPNPWERGALDDEDFIEKLQKNVEAFEETEKGKAWMVVSARYPALVKVSCAAVRSMGLLNLRTDWIAIDGVYLTVHSGRFGRQSASFKFDYSDQVLKT